LLTMMAAFSGYFALSWLFLSFFTLLPDKIRKQENYFIYFTSTSLHISLIFVISDSLKWLKMGKDIPLFLSEILYCIVIFPLTVLLCIHYLNKAKSAFSAAGVAAVFVLLNIILDYAGLRFKLFTFTTWNFGFTALYFLLMLLICRMMLIWYRNVMEKEAVSR
jgi:hypothetical protein